MYLYARIGCAGVGDVLSNTLPPFSEEHATQQVTAVSMLPFRWVPVSFGELYHFSGFS